MKEIGLESEIPKREKPASSVFSSTDGDFKMRLRWTAINGSLYLHSRYRCCRCRHSRFASSPRATKPWVRLTRISHYANFHQPNWTFIDFVILAAPIGTGCYLLKNQIPEWASICIPAPHPPCTYLLSLLQPKGSLVHLYLTIISFPLTPYAFTIVLCHHNAFRVSSVGWYDSLVDWLHSAFECSL